MAPQEVDGEEEMLEEDFEAGEEEEMTVIEIPKRQNIGDTGLDLYEGRISATERRKRTFERSMEQIEKMISIEQQDKDYANRKVNPSSSER